MAKPFLTYEQQINKLINEKQLIITNPDTAKSALESIGYFALIGGYKTPFINPMTRIYEHTSFEDIYALYKFDRNLRELTFKYLCEIEQKIRQLISYHFCNLFGEQQICYLTDCNYNLTTKNTLAISKLISILSYHANKNTEHAYLVHQRKVYHNVPLWVVMNALTFGQTSNFYRLLPFQLQSDISKAYPHVNEKSLENYLKCLTLFRNVCAHNERLYNFRLQIDFPDSVLHKKLGVPKSGTQYTHGKRDYFGLVIAFRYLLSNDSFRDYKRALSKLIHQYCRQSSRIKKENLLYTMGLPDNWEKITRYKL
jgi:abortive infection bacteriophage resistance protein